MVAAQPHYLLFCDTYVSEHQLAHAAKAATESDACNRTASRSGGFGRWHFVLERLDGPERLEAADGESGVNAERLALLSVVRGLEALEQPSQVTLVTTSRYVSRGLRYGLNSWRETGYTWERFGVQKPIRNSDLWRRIDGAMQFHGITCRLIQAPQPVNQQQAAELANGLATGTGNAATGAVHVEPSRQVRVPQSHSVPSELTADGPNTRRRPSQSEVATGREAIGPRVAASSSSSKPAHDSWWQAAAGWSQRLKARSQLRPAFFGT